MRNSWHTLHVPTLIRKKQQKSSADHPTALHRSLPNKNFSSYHLTMINYKAGQTSHLATWEFWKCHWRAPPWHRWKAWSRIHICWSSPPTWSPTQYRCRSVVVGSDWNLVQWWENSVYWMESGAMRREQCVLNGIWCNEERTVCTEWNLVQWGESSGYWMESGAMRREQWVLNGI